VKLTPNLLTGARIALAPYVFYLISAHEFAAVLNWFVVAAVTDALDGFLARRFGGESKVGALLDPIADKILLSGAFLFLAIAEAIPIWLTVIVLGRDVLILLAAVVLFAIKKSRQFPPSVWGKLSTLVQILYVISVVGAGAGYLSGSVASVLAWAVVALTAWSGADYARRYVAGL
jgi:cardiolipin synthase (CMP-forming)